MTPLYSHCTDWKSKSKTKIIFLLDKYQSFDSLCPCWLMFVSSHEYFTHCSAVKFKKRSSSATTEGANHLLPRLGENCHWADWWFPVKSMQWIMQLRAELASCVQMFPGLVPIFVKHKLMYSANFSIYSTCCPGTSRSLAAIISWCCCCSSLLEQTWCETTTQREEETLVWCCWIWEQWTLVRWRFYRSTGARKTDHADARGEPNPHPRRKSDGEAFHLMGEKGGK